MPPQPHPRRRSRALTTPAQEQAPAQPGVRILGVRIFYGWWIVLAALGVAAIAGGTYTLGFTAFFLPLEREFGVTRGAMALMISIGTLSEAVTGPIFGYFLDKVGPRRLMLFGVAALGLGFLLLSTAQSILVLGIFYVVFIAAFVNAATFLPPNIAIANWFFKRRSIALAIAMCGYGLGGFVVRPIQWVIDEHGWRTAAVVIAVTVWVAGTALALIVRPRPEDYGQLPDGAPVAKEDKEALARSRQEGFTFREVLRTRTFWLVSGSFMLRGFVLLAMTSQMIPMVKSKGFSESAGASLLGIFGVVMISARLIAGAVADKYPKNVVIGLMGGLLGASMVVIVMATEMWHLYLFIVLYAIAWGGSGASMMLALRADYFGRKAFGRISGASTFLVTSGSLLGAVYAGEIFDSTGSYDIAFYSFIGCAMVSMLLMFWAKKPQRPQGSTLAA